MKNYFYYNFITFKHISHPLYIFVLSHTPAHYFSNVGSAAPIGISVSMDHLVYIEDWWVLMFGGPNLYCLLSLYFLSDCMWCMDYVSVIPDVIDDFEYMYTSYLFWQTLFLEKLFLKLANSIILVMYAKLFVKGLLGSNMSCPTYGVLFIVTLDMQWITNICTFESMKKWQHINHKLCSTHLK